LKPLATARDTLADWLADARRHNRQIPVLPAELVPESADDAYAVDMIVAERLGWEPLGWKIAGTTSAVREKLRLDAPIYGRTYRRFAATSPARFKACDLLDPLIECEFFVTLAKPLPPRREAWTMDEVVNAIDTVHIGVEIAECPILPSRCRACLRSSLTAAPRGDTSLAIQCPPDGTAWPTSRFGWKSARPGATALEWISWAPRCSRCAGSPTSAAAGATA